MAEVPENEHSKPPPSGKQADACTPARSLLDALRPASPPPARNARLVRLSGVAADPRETDASGERVSTEPPLSAETAATLTPKPLPAATTSARRRAFRRSSLAAAAGLLHDPEST